MKDLFTLLQPLVGISPGAVSTDCDQALRNAISSIFSESATLLCLWHANENIQRYCKGKFDSSDAYNNFFMAWQRIVQSRTTPEYKAELLQLSTEYSDTPGYSLYFNYIDLNLVLRVHMH